MRTRTFGRTIIVLLAAVVPACSAGGGLDLTDPLVIAAQLPGTWSETFSVPGASTILNLTVDGTIISGDGTFQIEAGASGTITVEGQISGDRVILQYTRSDGLVGHYDAALTAEDTLEGQLYFTGGAVSSDPAPAEFKRVQRAGQPS